MNFDKLLEPEIFPIFMFFVCAIAAIIGIFAYNIYKVNSDNELKRDMLERGMSPEDIETVLNAGKNKDEDE